MTAALLRTDRVFWEDEARRDAKMRGSEPRANVGKTPWVDADSANRSVVEYFMANVIIGDGDHTDAEGRWNSHKSDARAMISNLKKNDRRAQISAWNAWLDEFNAQAKGAFGDAAPQFTHVDVDSGPTVNPDVEAHLTKLSGDDGLGALYDETWTLINPYADYTQYAKRVQTILETMDGGFEPKVDTNQHPMALLAFALVKYAQTIIENLTAFADELGGDEQAPVTALAIKWGDLVVL